MTGVYVCYQRAALVVGHAWYRLVTPSKRPKPISWVVGADDVASMILQIARAIPGSLSVSLYPHASYADTYDLKLKRPTGSRGSFLERVVKGPWILARLMHQARGFIYVGQTGFLLHGWDNREFEFRFLKRHGLALVCYWCGSDIRSTRRMNELEHQTGLPNISTYISVVSPALAAPGWEEIKRGIAAVGDRHADAMFSNSVDHLSYLQTPTEPFLYFLEDDSLGDVRKFDNLDRLVVVHATSSPVIKGTPLVRAAVAQLRDEGYDFEYVELMGVPNTVVRSELRRAHIALNQFYGFSTAVFGAEALAAGAVVMMSADETIETDFAPGSNDAWVVTKHHQVYSNLKRLLDSPRELAPIAQRGMAWAKEYATVAGASPKLMRVLDSVLDGTYEPPARRDG